MNTIKRTPGQPFIVVISYEGDEYKKNKKDIKGDAYYTISNDNKEKIWYDDGVECSWAIPKPFTPIVINWINSGLNLAKGDLFYLTWNLSCHSYNQDPQFYWDGKKVKSTGMFSDGRIFNQISDDIYFPEFPFNYYGNRFGSLFRVSPFLQNVFRANATYGIPPYGELKDVYDRQKVFYSWFWHKTNEKYIQYWVIAQIALQDINEHSLHWFKDNMPFYGKEYVCEQCEQCKCDDEDYDDNDDDEDYDYDDCTHKCSCGNCLHDECKKLRVFNKDIMFSRDPNKK